MDYIHVRMYVRIIDDIIDDLARCLQWCHVISLQLTLHCHDKMEAPCEMFRGSSTSDREFAYFMPWDSPSVYRYEWSTEKWDKLPPCPYSDSAVAIVHGALTAVGGYDGHRYTNQLITLRQSRWIEELPPMKYARSQSAVVSSSDGEYIIVIGGYCCSGGGGGHWVSKVELFQVRGRTWYVLIDLPQLLYRPSAAVCGDRVHVIGDDSSGYSSSLQDLQSSYPLPTTSQSRSGTTSWSPLPPLPVTNTTAVALCKQLVIIGGAQSDSAVSSIHQLVDEQWVKVGCTSSGRWLCLAATCSPSADKMIIVGGWRGPLILDSVEECVVI